MPNPRLEALFARTKSGIKPGLEVMEQLVEALGNPERAFLCVHIAGTNGKGSVSAMVASMLEELGLKVGLFTSPHLIRVNERIRIQGEDVSDDLLLAQLDRIEEVEAGLERPPTFFETLTALAFLCFRESGVQIAVLETGLGGRLDSTNVVQPLVTGITRIDLDHQEFLGDTLPLIAGEKAGILKPGRPAVFGAQQADALGVLQARAEEVSAPVWDASQRVSLSGRKVDLDGQQVVVSTPDVEVGKVRLPLLGGYQMENLATAVTLMEAIADALHLDLSPDLFKNGLAKTQWTARGQVLSQEPPVLLDVAHNPGGASALVAMLQEVFGRKAKGVWVWSALADKDPAGFLKVIQPHVAELFCVPLDNPRGISVEELCAVAESLGIPAEAMDVEEAKELLPQKAASADFGCIAGSVYLAGAWLADTSLDPGERIR